jgi:hypothetical protein
MDGGDNHIRPIHRRDHKKNCTHVELFRNKNGEGVGKAILTVVSVADRQTAVSKSRVLKIRGIFLNNAETELDLKRNKKIRAAFGEIKKQWEGERDDNTWEVEYKIPQHKLKNEAELNQALNTHGLGAISGTRMAHNKNNGMEYCRKSEEIKQARCCKRFFCKMILSFCQRRNLEANGSFG